MFEQILAIVTANWSFIAVAFILGLVGEVIKSIVIGDNKEKAKETKWKNWFIRTMPLHPVVAGALLGLFLSAVVPEVIATGGIISSVLYFSAAGGLSTWFYMTLKSIAPKATKALQKKLTGAISKTSKSSAEKENPEE